MNREDAVGWCMYAGVIVLSLLMAWTAFSPIIEKNFYKMDSDVVVSDVVCDRRGHCRAELAEHGFVNGGLAVKGETVCLYKNDWVEGGLAYTTC